MQISGDFRHFPDCKTITVSTEQMSWDANNKCGKLSFQFLNFRLEAVGSLEPIGNVRKIQGRGHGARILQHRRLSNGLSPVNDIT